METKFIYTEVRRNGSSYDVLADVIVDDNDAICGDGGGLVAGAVVAVVSDITHKNGDGTDTIDRKVNRNTATY